MPVRTSTSRSATSRIRLSAKRHSPKKAKRGRSHFGGGKSSGAEGGLASHARRGRKGRRAFTHRPLVKPSMVQAVAKLRLWLRVMGRLRTSADRVRDAGPYCCVTQYYP